MVQQGQELLWYSMYTTDAGVAGGVVSEHLIQIQRQARYLEHQSAAPQCCALHHFRQLTRLWDVGQEYQFAHQRTRQLVDFACFQTF
jgi:hypothetical protein